jgi:hypothetical protein
VQEVSDPGDHHDQENRIGASYVLPGHSGFIQR